MSKQVNRDRTVYELQPIPSRRPTQVEASSQKELRAALQEVLKLNDKEARSAAYLLDAGGSITMSTWSAKPIGVLQFAPLETTQRSSKPRKKPRPEGEQSQERAQAQQPSEGGQAEQRVEPQQVEGLYTPRTE